MSGNDEADVARARFLALLKEIDPTVDAVIPTRATGGNFLISLAHRPPRPMRRKFISVGEDDLIDMADDAGVRKDVASRIRSALDEMSDVT